MKPSRFNANFKPPAIIQIILESTCIPAFYILLSPGIARGDFKIIKPLLSSSTINAEEMANLEKSNMITSLYANHLLYVFLSLAPEGAMQFREYIKLIIQGKVKKNTAWIQQDPFYMRAKAHPHFATSSLIIANILVFCTQTLTFLILGATGAKDSIDRITEGNTTLSDAAALGLGSGSMITNHVLYTYAFISIALTHKNKITRCCNKKNTTDLSESIEGELTTTRTRRYCTTKKIKDTCLDIPAKIGYTASLIYCSSYVKNGLENANLPIFSPVLVPLQSQHGLYYRLFLWLTEMILLYSLEDPTTRLKNDMQALTSVQSKGLYLCYKSTLLALTLLPVLSITPTYSIFLIAALASSPVEKAVYDFLYKRTSKNNDEIRFQLLADNTATSQINNSPKTNITSVYESDTTSEYYELSSLSRMTIAFTLVCAVMSCLSCIALTNPKNIEEPSSSMNNSHPNTTPQFFSDMANMANGSGGWSDLGIGLTGILANMLGIKKIINLVIGTQHALNSTEKDKTHETSKIDDEASSHEYLLADEESGYRETKSFDKNSAVFV